MPNLLVERLRKLPSRSDETWQAALLRMPAWAGDENGQPVRPCMVLCVSSRTGCVGSAKPRSPGQASPGMVLEAVVSLATDRAAGGYRPGRLEVRQPEVAVQIAPLLAEVGISVVHEAELADLDGALGDMTRHFLGGRDDPAALAVPGVTIEHLRSFAGAAKEFYEAGPWRHWSNQDLIEIMSPAAEEGRGWATVMGAGRRTFGLAFYESRRQHQLMFERADPRSARGQRGVWSFTYDHITDLPLGDADAWMDHGLPVAGDGAYPFLGRLGPGREVTRPTPKQWAFVEGLARALARTSGPEMDSGRWAKTVETAAGPREYVLSLPALLETSPRPMPPPTRERPK